MHQINFLHQYLNLQLGILFDQIRPVADAWFCTNESGETPFWNQAVAVESLDERQQEKIVKLFTQKQRTAAFYLPEIKDTLDFKKRLLSQDYELMTSEVFMFHKGSSLPKLDPTTLKKVTTEADLKIFMKIFDDCYRSEDEKAGRGSGFNQCLQSTKDDWYRFHRQDRVEFFLLYFEGLPVGIISLTNFEGLGYLSNIGILPKCRGLGLGKQITLLGVMMSKKHGNKKHFLIAEMGGKPEQIYQKIGFKPQLTCNLLVAAKISSQTR